MPQNNYEELLKFFIDEFKLELLLDQEKPTNKKENVLIEIFNRINDISTVFERLNRYEVYFSSFYPADIELINEAEALEYHLHSYLQEFYSLKEKIVRLIRYIKKSVKHFPEVGNPEIVYKLLDHVMRQVEKGMEQVTVVRGKHVHDMTVRDTEISKAKAIKAISNLGAINKERAIVQYESLIKNSKKKYLAQATKNKEQINKLKNHIAPRIGHIVAFLFDKDHGRFAKMM